MTNLPCQFRGNGNFLTAASITWIAPDEGDQAAGRGAPYRRAVVSSSQAADPCYAPGTACVARWKKSEYCKGGGPVSVSELLVC